MLVDALGVYERVSRCGAVGDGTRFYADEQRWDGCVEASQFNQPPFPILCGNGGSSIKH